MSGLIGRTGYPGNLHGILFLNVLIQRHSMDSLALREITGETLISGLKYSIPAGSAIVDQPHYRALSNRIKSET